MTPQQHDEYVRNIARDVRFLSNRQRVPAQLAGSLLFFLLSPVALIVVFGFLIEVGIQLRLIAPVPKRVHPTSEEPWPPKQHRSHPSPLSTESIGVPNQ